MKVISSSTYFLLDSSEVQFDVIYNEYSHFNKTEKENHSPRNGNKCPHYLV